MREVQLVRGEVPRLAREAGLDVREVPVNSDERQALLGQEVLRRVVEVVTDPQVANAAELQFYLSAHLEAHGISMRAIEDMLDVRRINLGGVGDITAIER